MLPFIHPLSSSDLLSVPFSSPSAFSLPSSPPSFLPPWILLSSFRESFLVMCLFLHGHEPIHSCHREGTDDRLKADIQVQLSEPESLLELPQHGSGVMCSNMRDSKATAPPKTSPELKWQLTGAPSPTLPAQHVGSSACLLLAAIITAHRTVSTS